MKRELEIEECEGVLDLDQIGHLDFLILKPYYITWLQELEDVGERGIRPEMRELDIDEGDEVPEHGCTHHGKKSRSSVSVSSEVASPPAQKSDVKLSVFQTCHATTACLPVLRRGTDASVINTPHLFDLRNNQMSH